MVPPSQIDHLVTDSTADVGQLGLSAAAGVHVHVVEVGETDGQLAGQPTPTSVYLRPARGPVLVVQ